MTLATTASNSTDLSELTDALNRLNKYSTQLTKDWNVLTEAYNPIKDTLQVTSQVQDLLEDLDWSKLSANFAKPELSVTSLKELNEIQTAAFQLFTDSVKENVDAAFASEKENVGKLQEVNDPVSLAATMINLAIDQLEDFNSHLVNQSKATMRVKSAYMAWWQKTLQTLTA